MNRRTTLISLLIMKAVVLGHHPSVADSDEKGDVLTRVIAENKNLAPADPRELAMKIRSLLRDEYTFFRGAAAAFYRSTIPIAKDWVVDETGWVLLHGDIHIGNVGTYQGPGEAGRDIRFGVVDLDETVEGPFQFDLLRALTAVRFAAPLTGNQTFPEVEAAQILCDGYARTLSGEEGYSHLISRNAAAVALLRKAGKNDARKYVSRYAELKSPPRFRTTRIKDGQVKDILESVKGPDRESVIEAIWTYLDAGCDRKSREQFRFQNFDELRSGVLDVARWTRLESSGSQGVHKYLALLDMPLTGNDSPMILELKEQPVPSLATVEMLRSAMGPERAKEVAAAYGQMLKPPPRLIGFTRIGDRGFLVRTKDPWNEDLEPADFDVDQKANGAVQAAALLGEVLGLAHRNALLQSNRGQRIPAILDLVTTLPPLLRDRSKVIEESLRQEYRTLLADPKAQELAAHAEGYINRFEPSKP